MGQAGDRGMHLAAKILREAGRGGFASAGLPDLREVCVAEIGGGVLSLIRAIDLCSGAGGWSCAARDLPIHIELAVDHWPVACKTYELNHLVTRVECADLRDAKTQEMVLKAAK